MTTRRIHHNLTSPTEYSSALTSEFPDILKHIESVIHHPRSLVRPLANWRPPSVALPATGVHAPTSATIRRYRVGEHARNVVRQCGEPRAAAYLISIRFSSKHSSITLNNLSEGWIRGLLPDQKITCVHELDSESAPTFCWLVDKTFDPIQSPASLFTGHREAA